MDYLGLPLIQIHKALVDRKITPLELTQEAIRRAKVNKDNAFELILEQEALEYAASLAEPEEGNVFWGIPYVAKDNFSTKDIPTTASSSILNGYKPLFDATVIKRLKEKKAILIGKTTLDELAMGGTGTTGHLGTTYNPWDPSHQRMIGGSSCGSAAAVAADIVPFALGSDTGDSVRRPAAYAGLVGFKPTWSRISRYGLFPFAPSLDHVGFFTRYVEDSALLLELLAGRDDRDSTSSVRPVEQYFKATSSKPKGKRIAVIDEIVNSVSDPTVKTAFEKTIVELETHGFEISHVAFGKDLLESIRATYIVISCAEATSNNANLDGIKFGPYCGGKTYQEVMTNARTKGLSELIKRRFVIGSFALMQDNREELFVRAQKNRTRLVERVNQILAENDFIYVPTAPSIAPRFDEVSNRLFNDSSIVDNHLPLENLAGLPSISLPLGFEDGMPFGVSLTGRAFEEEELYSMAAQIEAITGLAGIYAGRESK